MDSSRNLNKKINGRSSLRPHQVKAVKAVINEFLSQPRTKYIAACGTGKTMVGLHVAEALKPRSVIVFLPSLALIRQTLIEWSREKMFNGNYANLFVCSDQTITDDLDSIVMTEEEFGHPITTDSLSVKHFLKAPSSGVKLIFSTYNSARVLAEGTPSGFQFDFAVMDEAHRTAGPAGKPFGVVLDDTKLPIKKRLFLTATPRLYKVKKAVLDSEVLSYSMDSPQLYGTTADRLPFKDAVEMNLITPYEILASVITSADVDRELLEKELLFNNKPFDAKRIANLVSIRDAVRQHDIKKIFTFHGRIEEAREFVEAKNPPIQDFLPDFKIFHINGEMPMEKRNRIMEEFRLAERALISNAKVLSEGIDVPSVDLVTFMCPKKSTVDIVQAVGRVSRNHPGKKTGYVLLPLFLDKQRKETEDEAFDRTDFSFMWNVFKSMKSEDDTLDLIIKNESMKMGEAGDGYIPDFKDKIRILGSPDTLEAIGRSIKTMIIETIGESWEYWYGLLSAYKKDYGDCLVPQRFQMNHKKLGVWVSNVRKGYHGTGRQVLTPDQEAALNRIGFVWNPEEAEFQKWFNTLLDFQKEHGHCIVPKSCVRNGKKIGYWVCRIRSLRKKPVHKHLTPDRIARLDAIGFIWHSADFTFNKKVTLLKAFYLQHGHSRVPHGFKMAGENLGGWVNWLRRNKREQNPSLTPEKLALLDELKFEWNPYNDDFNNCFQRLINFTKQHGHCLVPQNYRIDGINLGQWVSNRRLDYRNKVKTLTPEKIKRLNGIGFVWDPQSKLIDENLALLEDYKKVHGHCRVPCAFKTNGVSLGNWVSRLRKKKLKKDPSLTPEIIARLDGIGFDWDPAATIREMIFKENFDLLADYQKQNGTFSISRTYRVKGKNLGAWVHHLRSRYRDDSLLDSEIKRLNDIGFVWNPKPGFELFFQLLLAFKKEHGHCRVPHTYKSNKRDLGAWVRRQRKLFKINKLPKGEFRELEAIGFVWDAGYDFNEYVAMLKEYKTKHGDCLVPSTYKRLGPWVSRQRRIRKSLTNQQTAALNALGFVWDPRSDIFEDNLGLLATFVKKNGHCRVPNKYRIEGKTLGNWVCRQRQKRAIKHPSLTPEMISRLDKLGFVWALEDSFEEYFHLLLNYKKKKGDCLVPGKYKVAGKTLGSWVINRRLDRKKNRPYLTPERIARLDAIGFVWDPLELAFEEKFKLLVIFKKEHGHCLVPHQYKIKGISLGLWVSNLRSQYKEKPSSLKRDKIKRLNAIGFVWKVGKGKGKA